MTKQDKIRDFDVNALATNPTLYGLPFTEEESEVIVIPVPWQVTVSYGDGTMDGPQAVLKASAQVDIFDRTNPDFWQKGIFMINEPEHLRNLSLELRALAEKHIAALENEETPNPEWKLAVDKGCMQMNQWVESTVSHYISLGKKVILLGGDHSTPLGMFRAMKKHHSSYGILQIDAHADLRNAFEGFTYSHASITYNALQENLASSFTLLGIRDFCRDEFLLGENDERINIFYDRDVQFGLLSGKTWKSICDEVISTLPEKVYITFDIDGLDPRFCPNTGTPVAGGYTPDQILFLVGSILKSGRSIIGFDINEVGVSDDEWDANVAARLLFQLSSLIY
ncbi:MAG: agmatinase [Flavobacteriales bacterium]|nr:MAG: agmatinase [Flavobacteriales bacterium]